MRFQIFFFFFYGETNSLTRPISSMIYRHSSRSYHSFIYSYPVLRRNQCNYFTFMHLTNLLLTQYRYCIANVTCNIYILSSHDIVLFLSPAPRLTRELHTQNALPSKRVPGHVRRRGKHNITILWVPQLCYYDRLIEAKV